MADVGSRAGRIVVGVDGSEPSKDALRWAIRQAELTQGVVEAITAWDYPQFYGWYGWVPTADEYTPAGIAQRVLAESVDEVAGTEPPVEIRARVEEGSPAQVLLRVAEGAELLVVGNRGHGGFTGALLGSVGQHCSQHAPCPVVIMRGLPDSG